MKNRLAFFIGIIFMAACGSNENKNETSSALTPVASEDNRGEIIEVTGKKADTSKKSIKAYARGNINGRILTISYHSPAVRNRIIWGGLVPFNQPWVTGAHMATSIEMESALIINGQSIPAGKYAFFTIPSQAEWIAIINKNWQQHLTDEYDAKDDILRWKLKPDSLSNVQERLRFYIDQTGEYKGTIEMTWEKCRIAIPFEVKK